MMTKEGEIQKKEAQQWKGEQIERRKETERAKIN